MLSKKENFMRLITKQVPEYIPGYNLFWGLNGPSVFNESLGPERVGIDYFGVEWFKGDNPTGASLPKPGTFILDDITKWRDVIKVPDFANSVDWDIMSQKDLQMRTDDLPYGGTTAPSVGFFEAVMSFMGFDEGLMACAAEPEEVKALMEYLCDWSVELAKKFIYYYKPDFGFMGDDIAHERNPFISLEMFQDIFAPVWRRYYAVFLEAGLPVGMHNCGHFELFLDDLVDMGCTFWDPVQSSNDAPAIKAKFGNNLALCTGGPETRFLADDASEEEVRALFKAYCDELAPGGGFAIFDFMMPEDVDMAAMAEMPGFDPVMMQRMLWIADEFNKIKFSYYE